MGTSPLFSQVMVAGLGGFVGTSARYLITRWLEQLVPPLLFPLGTLVVNLVGCFAIGYLGGSVEFRQLLTPTMRIFLLIGLLGGFTTYSTFAYESLWLAQSAEFAKMLGYLALHVVGGFTLAWVGHALSRFGLS